MRNGFLGSLATLLTGAGLALAQTTAPPPGPPPAPGPVGPPAAPYAGPASPSNPAVPPGPGGVPGYLPQAGGPGNGGCDGCGGGEGGREEVIEATRFWASAEYLLWRIKGYRVPPLVTTGTLESQGILGNPGTVLLFGDSHLDNDWHSGARFSAGYWFDCCQSCGLEASFFFLGDRTHTNTFNSNGGLLTRPFFNANQGIPFVETAGAPGVASGSISVENHSKLYGGEVSMVHCCCRTCDSSLDAIAGVLYLNLEESLSITEVVDVSPNVAAVIPSFAPFAGQHIVAFDRFATRNQFYGGQVGLTGERRFGRAFVNGTGTLALGWTHEDVDITGFQVRTSPGGATTVSTGGLLALNSNIGHFTRDEFAVVPVGQVNVGYYITPRLNAFVGYTFLYWSRVVRPGDQIDTNIDITRIPNFLPPGTTVPPVNGPAVPGVPFKSSDFWAQGINFGVEIRW
jgi:hypothetical protein